MLVSNYIISLGVGWLALLILERGQCESLTTGIGAEGITPTSFLFLDLNIIIHAEFGSRRHLKMEKSPIYEYEISLDR